MQRLHPPIQHFRETSQLRNVLDWDSGLAQQLGSSASGDEFNPHVSELTSELHQAGFIGHAEDGTLNLEHMVSPRNAERIMCPAQGRPKILPVDGYRRLRGVRLGWNISED